jgi:hypothetical protein
MKVRLHWNDDEHGAAPPYDGAAHVIVYDFDECPFCHAQTLKVRGRGIRETTHDTHTADAKTVCCDRPIGRLVVTVDTIFGIEEDERVLQGMCRVY